jgi:hypothetical protein
MLLTTIIPSLVEHGVQPFSLAKLGATTHCLAKPGERPLASLSLEERPPCLAKPGPATTCPAKHGATPHC